MDAQKFGSEALSAAVAVQLGLASPETIRLAWTECIRTQRGLDQILVEQGVLQGSLYCLKAIVQACCEMHGGNSSQALGLIAARLPFDSAFPRSLLDGALETRIPLATGAVPTLPLADQARAQRALLSDRPALRFEKIKLLGRGGLGQVWLAQDHELDRLVALKEIQERHAHEAEAERRFIAEASFTARLEHPGIVPVYSAGKNDSGKPYYAMRRIEGQTFTNAIDAFHGDRAVQGNEQRRNAELGKLLRRFVDMCNAVGFAHSRDVLHRDLKPDNVMLGDYGETLVVDWGLAKRVRAGAKEGGTNQGDPLAASTASDADQAATRQSEALGTIPFMSPEQARGQSAAATPASDVYGLGATLYYLLTGTVAFPGSRATALKAVKEGTFPRPREHKRWIPRALEAICLKAMALSPHDRYLSALDLKNDVDHWLTDEPVSAYRDPIITQARRWAKSHRVVVGMATAIVLFLIPTLLVANARLEAEKAETEKQRLIAVDETRKTHEQYVRAEAEKERAEEQHERAEGNLDSAMEAVGYFLVRVVDEELFDVPQFTGIRKDLLAHAQDFYVKFTQQRPSDERMQRRIADAQMGLVKILRLVGERSAALMKVQESMAVLKSLPIHSTSDQVRLADSVRSGGDIERQLGRMDNAREYFHRAAEILEQCDPDEINVQRQLGTILNNWGDLEWKAASATDVQALRKALDLFMRSRGIREAIVNMPGAVPHDSVLLARSVSNVSAWERKHGNKEEAFALCLQTKSLWQQAFDTDQKNLANREGLANTFDNLAVMHFFDRKEPESALAAAKQSIEIRLGTALVPVTYQVSVLKTRRVYAAALHYNGRADEAFAEYRSLSADWKRLQPSLSDRDSEYHDLAAQVHRDFATLLHKRGEITESIEALSHAAPLLSMAYEASPKNMSVQRSLADTLKLLLQYAGNTKSQVKFVSCVELIHNLPALPRTAEIELAMGVAQYCGSLENSPIRTKLSVIVAEMLRGRGDGAGSLPAAIKNRILKDHPWLLEEHAELKPLLMPLEDTL